MKVGLTPQREKFAQEVASGKSQADAYRAAFNVRPTTKPESIQQKASKLMAEVKVRSRVEELQNKITANLIQKVGITKEWVIDQLVDVHKMAIVGEPIVTSDGQHVGNKQNLSAANKSLELIGIELGMFKRNTINVNVEDPIKLLLSEIMGTSIPFIKDVEAIEINDVDDKQQ